MWNRIDITVRTGGNNNEPSAIIAPTGLEFQITGTQNCTFYLLFCEKKNDKKLIEQLKSGFKRTVKWNKYRWHMAVQSKNSNLNYLIDPTFTKVNSLFILSFSRISEGERRDYFSHYYVPNTEIKLSLS